MFCRRKVEKEETARDHLLRICSYDVRFDISCSVAVSIKLILINFVWRQFSKIMWNIFESWVFPTLQRGKKKELYYFVKTVAKFYYDVVS